MVEVWQTFLWMAVAYLAGVGTRDQIVRLTTRLAWWRLRHRR